MNNVVEFSGPGGFGDRGRMRERSNSEVHLDGVDISLGADENPDGDDNGDNNDDDDDDDVVDDDDDDDVDGVNYYHKSSFDSQEICKEIPKMKTLNNNLVEQSAKGRRYTATEITTVKTLLENGYSVHEIAIKLGRTISGIRAIKHKVLSRTSQKKAEELKALSLSNALAVVASSSSPSSSVALASQPPSLSTHDDVLLMKTVAEMTVVIQEDVKGEKTTGSNTGECEGGEDDG